MARRIVVVGFEGITALDLVGPMDVFDTAGRVATNSASRNDAYELIVAAPKKTPFRTTSGLRIQPDRALERLRGPIDTLLIAGGFGSRQAAQNTTLVRSVRRLAKQARRVGSVCTGAFVLAAAGFSTADARPRIGWHATSSLNASRTSRSTPIRSSCVPESTGPLPVSPPGWISVSPWSKTISGAMSRCVPRVTSSSSSVVVGASISFLSFCSTSSRTANPYGICKPGSSNTQDLSVPTLARRVAMSPRHFARVFRQEVGETPAAYVERARVEIARRLLETTRLPVDRVAEASGFGSTPTFRRVFRRRIGVPPRTYRTRFAAS